MIPVQIIATSEQMDLIADMTMKHYDQLAVMYFKMSESAIIKERDPNV